MGDIIKWGIIGLGNIAHKFAHDLNLHEGVTLYAVASRNKDKALEFKEKYNSVLSFDNYEDLAKCKEIDIVYIATPHVFHYENTIMCLEAGKTVLCEKPLSMNAEQSKKMIALAKEKNLFLMEALWTRFIPATEKVLELINNNEIGKVKSIKADFGFEAKLRSRNRLFDNKLGGGSLLDIGIYPIFLSLLILGLPSKITANATIGENNIDTKFSAILDYDDKVKALVESTFEEQTPTEALIIGENGSIKMHSQFHFSRKITLSKEGKPNKIFNINIVGNGYYHEIDEVVNCLKNGHIESEKLPHKFSLDLTTTLDKIRKQIGLKYDTDY